MYMYIHVLYVRVYNVKVHECAVLYMYTCKLCNCTCTSVCAHVMSCPVTVLGMSGSDKGSGVGDESAEAEDEFPQVQVEDSSSYMEQLDSEVSHLVCHTHVKNLMYCMCNVHVYMYNVYVRNVYANHSLQGSYMYIYMYMYVLYTCTCGRQVMCIPCC